MDFKHFLLPCFIAGVQSILPQAPANINADNGSFGKQPMLQFAFQQLASKQLKRTEDFNIKGSRFLNRNFEMGAIYSREVLKSKSYMRYDAYNDEVQIKINDSDTTNLVLRKDEDIYCVLSGKKMYYKNYYNKKKQIKGGYLFKIAETDSLILFERRLKRFKDGKEPVSSFELPVASRFVSGRELYYENKNSAKVYYLHTNKKAIFGLFNHNDTKAAKIKEFISKSKLNLKEPKSVAQVFFYYNTL